jgi:3'-5' exoribonuclease
VVHAYQLTSFNPLFFGNFFFIQGIISSFLTVNADAKCLDKGVHRVAQGTIEIAKLQVGDKIDTTLLVKGVKQGETRAGKPYLVVTVQDRTGEISGPIWDGVETVQPFCRPGEVVQLSATVQSYRDNLQLRIDKINPAATADADPAQFVPVTPQDRGQLGEELQQLVRSVKNPYLRRLLQVFFSQGQWWERFQQAPAAKGVHHAYLGGLLEHCVSVARLSVLVAGHYHGVDRCLLVAGALLHDIGKVEELQVASGVIDYTVRGRLLGHLAIGSELVARAAAGIDGFPEPLLAQLQHLILSHHGRQEFGSPTLPMTVEAFILSMLDDLDAKVNITEQLRRRMNTEEMTWTDYQRILERYLYLGGWEEEKPPVTEENKVGNNRQQSLF